MGTTVSQHFHYQLPFSYAEVHDSPSPSNLTNVRRTMPALCLGSTANKRGTYRFFSLTTGAVLRRYQWEELPINPTLAYNHGHGTTSADVTWVLQCSVLRG